MTFVASSDGEVQDYNEWFADQDDTMFGPQIDAQAWSTGAPPPPVARYVPHSWTTTARWAGLALGVMVTIAGLVLAILPHSTASDTASGWPSGYTNPPTPQVPAPPPLDTPDPPTRPFVMPTNQAAHATLDGEYFRLLWAVNLDPTGAVGGAQGSVNEAHETCAYMRRTGIRPDALAAYYHIYRPDTTLAQMQGYVHAAVTVYCPEEA